jgi:hypothetical protein
MLRNAWCGVQRDRVPHLLDIVLAAAMAPQEIARRVRAIHFEALVLAAIRRNEYHVVKHRADVQSLGNVLQLFALASQRAEQKDAPRVVIQQFGLGIAHELRGFARRHAVGNLNACDRGHMYSVTDSDERDALSPRLQSAFRMLVCGVPDTVQAARPKKLRIGQRSATDR